MAIEYGKFTQEDLTALQEIYVGYDGIVVITDSFFTAYRYQDDACPRFMQKLPNGQYRVTHNRPQICTEYRHQFNENRTLPLAYGKEGKLGLNQATRDFAEFSDACRAFKSIGSITQFINAHTPPLADLSDLLG